MVVRGKDQGKAPGSVQRSGRNGQTAQLVPRVYPERSFTGTVTIVDGHVVPRVLRSALVEVEGVEHDGDDIAFGFRTDGRNKVLTVAVTGVTLAAAIKQGTRAGLERAIRHGHTPLPHSGKGQRDQNSST